MPRLSPVTFSLQLWRHLLFQSQLHNLPPSSTGSNRDREREKKFQPHSYKKSYSLFLFPLHCAVHVSTQWLWCIWRARMLLQALAKAGREGKQINICTVMCVCVCVCIVGALELTSELLLPLLDRNCQSSSAHVCVIPTTNTSTPAACSDEQTQTYVYVCSRKTRWTVCMHAQIHTCSHTCSHDHHNAPNNEKI